jgi:hypothetical protein
LFVALLMKRVKFVKYLGVGVGSALLIVLLYLLSSTLTVAGGISRVIDKPTHLVRLQVINGSSVRGLTREMVKRLSDYADSVLEVRVVDTVDFDLRELPRSFVISREQDKTAATLLAKKLGLDPSEVVYRPLEHNNRQVSTTLVVGKDYESIKLP